MRTFLNTALLLFTTVILVFSQTPKSQKNKSDTVSLEIVEKDNSVKTIDFEWPFPKGPAPVGGNGDVIQKVEKIIKDNGVNCPPTRQKVSENVWLCSNGKKIRTNSDKLAKLLSKAWDK